MNSLYDFIVEPIGERYNNTIEVDNLKLILNTKIESYKFVNKTAKVIRVPLAYKTVIKPGDHVIIHHNVFRRYYDIKGKEKNSSKYFKDNLYFCQPDQIYMYKKQNEWKSFMDRCFVKPILNNDDLSLDKTKSLVGILRYGNSSLKELKIAPGDLVGYTPNSEWEFIIDNELLYCMKSNDIVIKYEHQGNETKYNPSWAKSS
jgi:hypothetical protein